LGVVIVYLLKRETKILKDLPKWKECIN